MKRALMGWLLLAMQAATGAPAEQDIFEFDLSTVSELGIRMAMLDGYAAAATEIVLREVPDPGNYSVRGWVVTEDAQGVQVTFVGEYLDGLGATFDVRPDAPLGEQLVGAAGRVLNAEERARYAARMTALGALEPACGGRYGAVVVSDPASDQWLVYALAESDQPHRVMAGGHYRVTVAADGFSIVRKEALFTDCLEIDLDPDAAQQPDAVLITHDLGDLPLEVHVYLSLLHQVDLAIATAGAGVWRVSGPDISQLVGIAPADEPRIGVP